MRKASPRIFDDLSACIGLWNNAGDDSDFNDNEESRNSRDNYIKRFGKILTIFFQHMMRTLEWEYR